MSFDRYGLSWPDGTSEATVELGAYRAAMDGFPTGREAWEHMYAAAGLLFPESVYKPHYWIARRMQCWCRSRFQTWIGPASCAKSTDAAMCVLLHWLSSPFDTTCVVCSTTVDMLEKRIFGELLRFYQSIPGAPGAYKKSETAVVLGDENSKNGIFGLAVLKGTEREALGNIIGLHNRHVVLVVDEMQATREAIVRASSNLGASGEFKFLGMGNPDSRLDPLGMYSEPKVGWTDPSIHPDMTDGWDTKWGRCEFFDGYLSPAVTDPAGEKKYPFLLSRRSIDEMGGQYGYDHPLFWSQRRGFFPPEGIGDGLFSGAFFNRFATMSELDGAWVRAPAAFAALDPAFSAGGDRCAYRSCLVGEVVLPEDAKVGRPAGKTEMRVLLGPPRVVKLAAGSGQPITNQIVGAGKELLEGERIPAARFGLDVTGTQGPLADAFDRELRSQVKRISFGGKPSDLPVSDANPQPASKVLGNRVTELWHNIHTVCSTGLVRGMDADTVDELCKRRFATLRPLTLETKKDMKKRLGKSPDFADVTAILLTLVRESGLLPLQSGLLAKSEEQQADEFAVLRELDKVEEAQYGGSVLTIAV